MCFILLHIVIVLRILRSELHLQLELQMRKKWNEMIKVSARILNVLEASVEGTNGTFRLQNLVLCHPHNFRDWGDDTCGWKNPWVVTFPWGDFSPVTSIYKNRALKPVNANPKYSKARSTEYPWLPVAVCIINSFSRTLQNPLSALTSWIFTCTDYHRLASRTLANSTQLWGVTSWHVI